MKTELLLLLVLNSQPQRPEELIEELEGILFARSAGPYGGARNLLAIANKDPDTRSQLIALTDITSCLGALDSLMKEGLVSDENGRYKILNEGILATAGIIRLLGKRRPTDRSRAISPLQRDT